MPRLTLRYATILKPKADFLKHAIGFSVNIPLTEENLKLRDQFVLLAQEEKSVTIEIESAQLLLFDNPPARDSENNIAESVEDEAPSTFKTDFEKAATKI